MASCYQTLVHKQAIEGTQKGCNHSHVGLLECEFEDRHFIIFLNILELFILRLTILREANGKRGFPFAPAHVYSFDPDAVVLCTQCNRVIIIVLQ